MVNNQKQHLIINMINDNNNSPEKLKHVHDHDDVEYPEIWRTIIRS